MPETHRHAAIMFTDIVGYTRLMGSDEEKAVDMLSRNRSIHQSCIEKFNGTLIKEIGDGILASFSLASEAVRCAIEIQKECKEQDIPLKIGIHEAEMIFSGSDVIGDGVNIASRLQEDAQEGCINISASVYRDIKNKADIKTRLVGDKSYKNVDEPIKVYRVSLDGSEIDDLSSFDYQKLQKKLTHNLIIGVIAAIIIIILFWMYLPVNKKSEKEKSIAVMPFDNESDDKQNEYFVNGMMEDIRNNLSIIGDLRVISKTSTEKYRDTKLSSSEIGKELFVNYLLEGTVQKLENQVKIHARLISVENDNLIWEDTYERDIGDIKNVFKIQSEIAQVIAKELFALITPQELEIIETIPTSNIAAYNIYNRAREEHTIYWLDNNNKNALDMAITFYRRALESDSAYAKAYTGLGLAYFDKFQNSTYFDSTYMDSLLIFSDKALSYDDQLGGAYYLQGLYYRNNGDIHKALEKLDIALRYDPNYFLAFNEKSAILWFTLGRFKESIINLHQSFNRNRGAGLGSFYGYLGRSYCDIGIFDKAQYYYEEGLKLDPDSARYFGLMYFIEFTQGKYDKAAEWAERDRSNPWNLSRLGETYGFLKQYKKAYKNHSKYVELMKERGLISLNAMHRIGFSYWKNGYKEEAKFYFNKQIEYCLESIRLNREYATRKSAYYDIAATYAFLGEKDKAFQYLEQYKGRYSYPLYMVNLLKNDPMFDSVRDNQRFQQIIKYVEEKYEKEHEEVKLWLEENDMIEL